MGNGRLTRMMVSGLLVTLESAACADVVAGAVRNRPGLTPGPVEGRWLPLAAEARDDAEARELHDWLMALPGVAYVDVTSVNFVEETGPAEEWVNRGMEQG